MRPRVSSSYVKFSIIRLLSLCFVLYIEIVQVGEPKFSELHDSHSITVNQGHQKAGVNNQIAESYYEESVRLDLEKQEPDLGESGHAVFLDGAAKDRGNALYKKLALNEEVSERLSYNRTLADKRNPACLDLKYDVDALPSASVIIVFYNEPYSVLVRTVQSTLNTCHEKILKEIILVDDGSTKLELGGKLEYYIRTRLPYEKVQLLRLKRRLGIVGARLSGIRIATGDVLIFLDAHCEANIGWCEPLVQRIKDSRSSVAVPIIDIIDAKSFEYRKIHNNTQLGGFQWNGHFDWLEVTGRELYRHCECPHKRVICPVRSPTMAGGLFAIDRSYYWEMGSYDEQMVGWGGENLEMSFRIWQCGGTIENIPCSRVGHVFREFISYNYPYDRDTHGINTARLGLVWMDAYVKFFFLYRPELKSHPHTGDVTDRLRLRKRLRCKSFDWYLKHVYPEKFVPTKDVLGYGRIKAANSNLCLDDLQRDNTEPFNMGLLSCRKNLSKSQFFSYTKSHVLRNELSCATVELKADPPYYVLMYRCLETDVSYDKWTHLNQQFLHERSGLCLDHKGLKSMDDVRVDVCDSDSETQRWVITHDEEHRRLDYYEI